MLEKTACCIRKHSAQKATEEKTLYVVLSSSQSYNSYTYRTTYKDGYVCTKDINTVELKEIILWPVSQGQQRI
jgi:PhoPQ-activated pathogenicity-related protein